MRLSGLLSKRKKSYLWVLGPSSLISTQAESRLRRPSSIMEVSRQFASGSREMHSPKRPPVTIVVHTTDAMNFGPAQTLIEALADVKKVDGPDSAFHSRTPASWLHPHVLLIRSDLRGQAILQSRRDAPRRCYKRHAGHIHLADDRQSTTRIIAASACHLSALTNAC
jgi:hypothetical protein